MAAKSDYYDILGVSKDSSADEIKKAYRKQAVEWHPDKHKDNKEAAEKRFKEINEAYQVLSDADKRSAYDRFGHQAFSPGGASGAQGFGGASPFNGGFRVHVAGNGAQGFDFGDPFEIFEQFFGGGNPFAGQQRVPRYSITLGKKRKIKIPPGVDEGSRINFGDFLLSVNVKPHDTFERDGADIYSRVNIPYSLAVLGGEIGILTVQGVIKVKIRGGTPSGTMVRLRGKGVKNLRGGGNGDHYIKIQIGVPQKLTRDQRQLIEEMKIEKL